jgi:AraC-like DNA-binding protein
VQPIWIERLRQYNVNLNNSADLRSNNLISLMTRLNDEIVNRDNVSALAIEALLLETAVEIYRQEKRIVSKDKSPRWLGDVKDYINTRLTSNLTISEIAVAANVHPVHLARVFRQNYGCTIADYIRQLRVEFACNRLSASNEPLADIALSCGFSDQSHFSKAFKKIMNLTPNKYRTSINSR